MVFRISLVICTAALVLFKAFTSDALNNGLALTPPMGWLSWQRFRCNLDCENYPGACISERLFKEMADLVASDGYADVGYEYIIVDDCWLLPDRDSEGRLQADPTRFPSGIKGLAAYVHSKGLKFGLYEDYGNYTCEGYPGIMQHLKIDAETIASWDVDYVKIDGCNSDARDMDRGYPEFGYYLNQTGRPIVYSCQWPMYQWNVWIWPNMTAVAETCNLWRNHGDVQDDWGTVAEIIDFQGNFQSWLQPFAGKGGWNDPDMLVIGNFGLSYEQSKSQMIMWAILASPLMMSVDLRTIGKPYRALLQNKKLIALNQDSLGIQGRRVYKWQNIQLWTRQINPVVNGETSYAVAFVNRRNDGTPTKITTDLKILKLTAANGYDVTDLLTEQKWGVYLPGDPVSADVNPHGTVVLKFTARSGSADAKSPSLKNTLDAGKRNKDQDSEVDVHKEFQVHITELINSEADQVELRKTFKNFKEF